MLDTPVLAEVLYQRMRPALVVGCFSTALLTAATFYDLPTARTGTGLLLERLTPYQNSNRVPVTIVDALVPDLGDRSERPRAFATAGSIEGLVTAVGYAMQHQIYPQLRPAAERYLATRLDQVTWRYFKRRRLRPRWRCPARSRPSCRSFRAMPPSAGSRAGRVQCSGG